MALTAEQFEQLPDFVKADYEQAGDGYQPKAEGKATALKASLDALDGKYKTAAQQIEEIKAGQQAAIEAAKAEALEQARSKGDVAAIEKRYQEQMADLERRSGETVQQLQDRLDKLSGQTKESARKSVLSDVASELKVFDDSRSGFARYVGYRVDIDPETGKETYLDENGGATSLDRAGFMAELAKDPVVNRMRQATVNQGGQANGNNGNGGGASKKFNEYTGAELKAIREATPEEYKRLRDEYHGTGG